MWISHLRCRFQHTALWFRFLRVRHISAIPVYLVMMDYSCNDYILIFKSQIYDMVNLLDFMLVSLDEAFAVKFNPLPSKAYMDPDILATLLL